MKRRILLTVLLAVLTSALGATPAAANVSCTFFADGDLEISSSSSSDAPGVFRSGNSIVVKDGLADANCIGSGTVQNMDRVIYIPATADFSQFTIDLRGGSFRPRPVQRAGRHRRDRVLRVLRAGRGPPPGAHGRG